MADTAFISWWGASEIENFPKKPLRLSARTLGRAIEEALMGAYTRDQLEVVLPDELDLRWTREDDPGDPAFTKRSVIQAYLPGRTVPQLAGLGRRILAEHEVADHGLQELLDAYDAGGGVEGPTKNLIFAANGPKPDIVLRDAMSNDIEIVGNAEYCLVYDQPIPAEGLRMTHLAAWWRAKEHMPKDTSDRDAALALHARLAASLGGTVPSASSSTPTRPATELRSTSPRSSRRSTCTTTRTTSGFGTPRRPAHR